MIYQEGFVVTLLSCRTCFGTPYAALYNIPAGLSREILKQVQDDKLFLFLLQLRKTGIIKNTFISCHFLYILPFAWCIY
jgi:hypothetical protein